MSEEFVAIKGISKSFKGSRALESVTASIGRGTIAGLVGPDGAGKTTLIRLMAGLLLPSAGTITIAGKETVRDAEELHSLIGYMPQKFGLYEELTVIQNLRLYADLKGVVGKERSGQFEKLLHFTALEPFVDRFAGALSGGMKQKLGLACALLSKPELLLLDEPSVGVDPISRRELWQIVRDLLDEGISVIWSTSYLDEAEQCDIVLLLNGGRLLYDGPPKNFTARVGHRSFLLSAIEGSRRQLLAQLLRRPDIVDGVIQGSNIRIVMGEGNLLPSGEVQAAISSAPPRFEDAFIDILGGGAKGPSHLAERTPLQPKGVEWNVEALELTKRFGNFTAADSISFQVRRGEIFGLLGPNGAGKSTTFKMLCGLLKPTSGRALVYGYDLREAPEEARSHIGYMAQKFSLYGNLSAQQNLSFFAGIYNLVGSQKRATLEEMVETFSLEPYLDTNAEELPLGFKQRLALACSVMHRPAVLFLDEPTSGVDPLTRREFWSHINGLVEKGITIMVTTHFMDEAEYCDRIALVYRSRIVEIGSPDALKRRATHAALLNPTLEDAFIHLIEAYDGSH